MKIKLILLLIVSLSLLTSCDNKLGGEETEQTLSTEAEPTPFPITIANVVIEAKPKSVAVLSPFLAEIICETGYGEVLSARGKYCDYPPTVLALKSVGSVANPNAEAILALKPEYVITSEAFANKDALTLEENGIKTIVLPPPTTIAEFKNVYEAIGLIFEGRFEGIERGDKTFSPVSKALDNSEALKIGSFLYVAEGFRIAGGNTLESAIFSCFGKNAAAELSAYTDSKAKTVADLQIDLIILSEKISLEELKANEVFSSLEAVKSNRIVWFNGEVIERPSRRLTEAVAKFVTDFRKLGE